MYIFFTSLSHDKDNENSQLTGLTMPRASL